MKIIIANSKEYKKAVLKLVNRIEHGPTDVADTVDKIIQDVRGKGDAALLRYTKKFDKADYTTRTMKVSKREIDKCFKLADRSVINSLEVSADRIRKFHARQKEKSWTVNTKGSRLGQLIRPLASAGIYVPGGAASYPSSVLMNAIPAQIAGVERIVMTTPTPNGKINPHTLVATRIAGVSEIYKVGGAQAVAALAYGTKTIKPVDKIVGPGNVYVAEAKRQLFGRVDIDMVAGPSEILILADAGADPDFIAADLLSQAEHDENAYPILVTTSRALADKVTNRLEKQLKGLTRATLIRKCLKKNCYAFVVNSLDQAFDLSNQLAPEHYELMIKNADSYVDRVINAGALFVGPYTPEALGDYCAGPNHVLPTGGSARFFSPLGVYDFIKRTSLISFTKNGLESIAEHAIAVAQEEGLTSHANAVRVRLRKQ